MGGDSEEEEQSQAPPSARAPRRGSMPNSPPPPPPPPPPPSQPASRAQEEHPPAPAHPEQRAETVKSVGSVGEGSKAERPLSFEVEMGDDQEGRSRGYQGAGSAANFPSSHGSEHDADGDGDEGDEGDEGDDDGTVTNSLHANSPSAAPSASGTSSYRTTSLPPTSPQAPAPKTKENMPSLGGLHNITRLSTDVPSELLARLLLKDEQVVGQFDTFFPDDSLPPRMRIYLTFFTLGLYQVFLFISYLFKVLKHLLCCCEGCNDPIIFHRDKAVVTSKGRLIFWRQSVSQRNFVDQQAYHRVDSETFVYHLEDLAQISLQYSDHYHCLSCCCHDYMAGVKLTFNHFDAESTSQNSQYIRIFTLQWFVDLANNLLLDTFVRKDARPGHLGTATPRSVLLVTNPDDHIYDGECGMEPFDDLLRFHKHVCSLLTNVRNGSHASINGSGPLLQRHYRQFTSKKLSEEAPARTFMSGEDVSKLAFPATFLSPRALRTEEYIRAFGHSEDGNSILPGVKELHNDQSNFVLCEDDGYVNVPLKYINLHENEEVIAAVGMKYKWGLADYVLLCFTLGIFRFNLFFKRVYNHTAIVLTTHRIVEIVLCQRKGRVPTELGKMDLFVSSYYPKNVYSGSMQVIDHGRQLLSTLMTCHGTLQLRLPANHFQFAQCMHKVAARLRPIPLSSFNDLESQWMPDLSHLSESADDDVVRNSNPAFNRTASRKATSPPSSWDFSKLEKLMLPLLPKEQVVFKHSSGKRFQPFGWLCSFFSFTPNQLFSNTTNPLYNCCNVVRWVQCCTCLAYPRTISSTAVLTGNSMFYTSYSLARGETLDSKENIGRSTSPSQFTLDEFLVVWAPIRSLREQSLILRNAGAKPLTQSKMCCNVHTRSFQARYVLHAHTTVGVVFPFAEDVRFKAWNRHVGLARLQGALSAVTLAVHDEEQEDYLL